VVHDDVDLCGEGTRRASGIVMREPVEEPAQELERLQRLDRRRTELVALLAHDMRDRLTVVATLADILRVRWDELSEHEKLESLDGIRRNGRRLARLIDESQQALTDADALRLTAPTDLASEIRRRIEAS